MGCSSEEQNENHNGADMKTMEKMYLHIDDNPGASAGQIAFATDLPQASVHGSLAKAQHNKKPRVIRVPHDGRWHWYHPTHPTAQKYLVTWLWYRRRAATVAELDILSMSTPPKRYRGFASWPATKPNAGRGYQA